MDISVLLPTRGRSDQMERSVRSLFDHASGQHTIEIIFGVDNDDTLGVPHFLEQMIPYLTSNQISNKIVVFEPMGYENLHEYLNSLSAQATGKWLFFWNDDAVMETQDWDCRILDFDTQFRLLSVYTHNDHPYSIFPIVPRAWFDCLGHLSLHSLNDAWLSNIAYMLDIFERIPVNVIHDRHDLTGNNGDATYARRRVLEGNPDQPGDFNHPDVVRQRLNDAACLATWLQDQGHDMSWFAKVCQGLQDPWEKLRINDTNYQVTMSPSHREVNSA